jgi:hypothetical protein
MGTNRQVSADDGPPSEYLHALVLHDGRFIVILHMKDVLGAFSDERPAESVADLTRSRECWLSSSLPLSQFDEVIAKNNLEKGEVFIVRALIENDREDLEKVKRILGDKGHYVFLVDKPLPVNWNTAGETKMSPYPNKAAERASAA